MALAAAPTGNGAALFAGLSVIYMRAPAGGRVAESAPRGRRTGDAAAAGGTPACAADPRRRLTRNQRFAGAAVTRACCWPLAHGHTPGPAATASAPSAVAGCGGSNEALANCMAAAAPYDWTGSRTMCLDELWTRESGFDADAANPTSEARRHPADHPAAMVSQPPERTGRQRQPHIAWGLCYIAAGRYGDPCAAWNHEQAAGWY